ncbi:hypothetical protein LWI28_009247 [Acer negundo]|uniref:Xrn1 N-terminal domain-containing protein n=1 Tax=Acer negundo TaxID=4023 RepID=A0AAD5JDV2_ACENE|nr:hypothetical protein LWI28_009247 [Acer negundo]
MGVPEFYRWLAEKYTKVMVDMVEEESVEIDNVKIPVDTSKPKPNNNEYNNLYIDMNRIIRPCFHPEDRVTIQCSVSLLLSYVACGFWIRVSKCGVIR